MTKIEKYKLHRTILILTDLITIINASSMISTMHKNILNKFKDELVELDKD